MASFFSLPIVRRMASDPPSLNAFARAFNAFAQSRPADARAYYHRLTFTLPSRFAGETAAQQNLDGRLILRVVADYCQEESNLIYFATVYQAKIVQDSYGEFALDSDAPDFEHAEAFLENYFDVCACNSCDERFPGDDMVSSYDDLICESCRDDQYIYSSYEDTYIHRDYSRDAIDSRGRSVVVHEDNEDFEWDDDEDTYVHVDYNREPKLINGYHASKRYVEPMSDDWTKTHGNRYFGVELEVECIDVDRFSAVTNINARLNTPKRRVFFENDGSLSSEGVEIITNPMSLPAHRELFKFLQDADLIHGIKSHNTNSCGLHVHVSRTGLTDLQIGKVVSFVNNPAHEWFIRGIARRYASGFCQIKAKKVKDCRSGDRYEAVNLTNRETIEFRMFKGSLRYEAVIAAIEFCHAILEFTRPSVSGIRNLTVNHFMSFCNKQLKEETKILRQYVNSRLSGRIDLSDAA